VEIEDLLLVVWLVAVEALLFTMTDRSPEMWLEAEAGHLPWTAWLVIVTLAFVVFTGGPADRTVDIGIMRRMLVLGPLYPVLSMITLVVGMVRGGPQSLAKVGGDVAEWPLPPAPAWLRRTAAVPAILMGESGFRAILTHDLPDLVVATSSAWSGPETSPLDASIAIGSKIFLLAVPFLFFVVGPRVAAGATADWRAWLARFVLFIAAAVFGGGIARTGAQ
jgi:hypothetical protein